MEELLEISEVSDLKSRRGTYKNIGIRLRSIRERFMLTKEEMAEKVLISQGELSELEKGGKLPPGPLFVALESLFMVSKNWLLTGKGEMFFSGKAEDKTPDSCEVVRLLSSYKNLSLEGKKRLMNILRIITLVEKRARKA